MSKEVPEPVIVWDNEGKGNPKYRLILKHHPVGGTRNKEVILEKSNTEDALGEPIWHKVIMDFIPEELLFYLVNKALGEE